MSLQARIETDMKQAMRDRNELARDTLRMLISDLKRKQVELLKDDLTDEEELAVLQRAVKTRQESVDQFEKAGRVELATKERGEIDVIRAYLPKTMSEEETRAAVDAAIRAAGSPTKKDLGVLMKAVMAAHKGRIDGKLTQRLLGERLS